MLLAVGVGVGVLDSIPVDVLCGQSLGACGAPRPGTAAEMADSGRGGAGGASHLAAGGMASPEPLSLAPQPPPGGSPVSSAAEGLQGGMWPPLPAAAQVQS